MARLSVLDRFRPMGAPGPAGPSGVPAVEAQGPATELIPVFAALHADVQGCEELVAAARRQAEHDVAEARTQAAAIVSQAKLDAGAARAEAAAVVERDARARDARDMNRARQEAESVEEAGLALIPAVVGKVTNSLLDPQIADPK
ncbi:hypothetical protein NHF46_07785 [Arthrobacter alpinus]|uniref:Uncharacterized protein n=1 Tax=Arthrobacter alpinus TaxID=656366 RepID=A0A0S2M131_9MICC|nr:hypothetical protein [Arthrobacter alpinus]ALO67318.1 hypothetical protein AS189_13435 [Arthrobacter alpinus]MDD0857664.1 hypothetical protein [Arthrobacter alpinus]